MSCTHNLVIQRGIKIGAFWLKSPDLNEPRIILMNRGKVLPASRYGRSHIDLCVGVRQGDIDSTCFTWHIIHVHPNITLSKLDPINCVYVSQFNFESRQTQRDKETRVQWSSRQDLQRRTQSQIPQQSWNQRWLQGNPRSCVQIYYDQTCASNAGRARTCSRTRCREWGGSGL